MLRYVLFYLIVAVQIYEWIFLLYILFSFLPINENTPVFGFVLRFVRALCDPVYAWVMRFLPPLRIGFLDFSPMYVFLIIFIVRTILAQLMMIIR